MAEDTEKRENVNEAGPAEGAGAAESKGRKGSRPGRDEDAAAAPVTGDGAEGATEAPAGEAAPVRVVRRSARVSPVGIVHIKATFNNTIVSISDVRGNVVSWSSAGKAGFKGSRKSTAFAATVVGQDAARQASAKGMHEVEVHIQGAGSGRESAVRAIQSSGLQISAIKDITPVAHNGCRQRKRRRV